MMGKKTATIKKCLICGSEFRAIPSRVKIGKDRYCSKKCYYKSKEDKPTWNKGITGYKQPKISETLRGRPVLSNRGENHYKWKGGKPTCKICGKELSLYKYNLCLEHRQVSNGERSWSWKGGITPLNKKIRHSLEYRRWREFIFKRDDYTCQHCGQKGGNLHADHIKQFAYYPELRFEMSNGRTLCKECHSKTDTYKHRIHEPAQAIL